MTTKTWPWSTSTEEQWVSDIGGRIATWQMRSTITVFHMIELENSIWQPIAQVQPTPTMLIIQVFIILISIHNHEIFASFPWPQYILVLWESSLLLQEHHYTGVSPCKVLTTLVATQVTIHHTTSPLSRLGWYYWGEATIIIAPTDTWATYQNTK